MLSTIFFGGRVISLLYNLYIHCAIINMSAQAESVSVNESMFDCPQGTLPVCEDI